jgi:PAT family beta-lactamase induction signal transducer AmpG
MLLLAVATVFAPSPRRAVTAQAAAAPASWLAPIRRLFARRGVWAVIAFIVLFKLGDYALVAMIKPFWVDAGYSAGQIGLIQGTVGMIATIAGALAGGAIVPRIGVWRALLVLGVAQAFASITYWFVAVSGAPLPLMWGASIVEHFTNGLGTAAFLTFLMGVCERRFAATQYAMLTALFGLSRFLGQYAAGDAVQAMGYARFFLLTFALAVPAWLLLPLVRRAETAPDDEAVPPPSAAAAA